MNVACNDNRFKLIEKYKKQLIECTNIEHSKDEMKVIDDILFRFWQMGWLDRLEEKPKGKWIREYDGQCETCSLCHRTRYSGHDNNFCPNCGAEMEAEEKEILATNMKAEETESGVKITGSLTGIGKRFLEEIRKEDKT